jgi:hypothetical protein
VSDVRTFALKSEFQIRIKRPLELSSRQYAKEFDEVKALGRQTGSSRTAEQQSLAGFVSSNPLPFMNRGLRDIAVAEGLTTVEQARLFGMTSLSTADALITCWHYKDYYNVWRPQTAIQQALTDGNPRTSPDAGWMSLIPNPGYPDLPSGFNCLAAGLMHAARLYFGTDHMSFSLTSPGAPTNVVPLPGSTREYTRFSDVIRDSVDGRILNGLHFRHADEEGARIGKEAAKWVKKHYFEPVD